jgi:hypothetical protein
MSPPVSPSMSPLGAICDDTVCDWLRQVNAMKLF